MSSKKQNKSSRAAARPHGITRNTRLSSTGMEIQRSLIASLDGTEIKTKRVKVRVADLHIDRRYQRDINKKKIESMVELWRDILCDDIKVADRSGKLYVIDGGHRVTAMRVRDIEECWAVVYFDIPKDLEATLFSGGDCVRSPLSPLQRFNARLVAKERYACGVLSTLKRFGLVVPRSPSRAGCHVCCISAVEAIYIGDGADALAAVCDIITGAWDDETHLRTSEPMFNGLRFFLKRWGGQVNMARLRSVLSRLSPERILQRSATWIDFTTRPEAIANAVAAEYNKHLSTNRLTIRNGVEEEENNQ